MDLRKLNSVRCVTSSGRRTKSCTQEEEGGEEGDQEDAKQVEISVALKM